MDGASAVISLGAFVATTIQQLNKLIQNIRKAPKELSALLGYLEQLNRSLTGAESLIRRLNQNGDQQGSLIEITGAVECCAKAVKSLEVLLEKAKGYDCPTNKLRKTMNSLKFIVRKEEILEVQTQIQNAVTNLNVAISMDISYRTYDIQNLVTRLGQHLLPTPRHLFLTASGQCVSSTTIGPESQQLPLIETNQPVPNHLLEISPKLPLSTNSSQSTAMGQTADLYSLSTKQSSLILSKEQAVTWYNGFFGTVTVLKKSKLARKSLELAKLDDRSMSEETIFVLTPKFMKRRYELRYMESFGRISRTLNVERVVDATSPVFEMARFGDIAGMYGAFRDGRASPDIVDPSGMGLLHYTAQYHHLEACIWLLNHGIDVNRVNANRHKALSFVFGSRPRSPGQPSVRTYQSDPQRLLNILELLVRKQEVSEYDVSDLLGAMPRPSEFVETYLSEYPAEYDMCPRCDAFETIYPALASILGQYASEPSTWEHILRRLIRRGANLHGPVYRNRSPWCINRYPCPIAEYGTPLEELVNACDDPVAAQIAADRWLRVLASEGCDPSTYLQEELSLHATEMQFTYPPNENEDERFDIPRQLHFQLGEHPSVSWDWWIDPASSATLVRAEFKWLVGTSTGYTRIAKPWPFSYPEYYISAHGSIQGQTDSRLMAHLLKQEHRATRRLWKNAAKLARAQSSKEAQNVPGAWVA